MCWIPPEDWEEAKGKLELNWLPTNSRCTHFPKSIELSQRPKNKTLDSFDKFWRSRNLMKSLSTQWSIHNHSTSALLCCNVVRSATYFTQTNECVFRLFLWVRDAYVLETKSLLTKNHKMILLKMSAVYISNSFSLTDFCHVRFSSCIHAPLKTYIYACICTAQRTQ